MLLNPPKFNEFHWALKFNSSMSVTILSKLLQFPGDGCYSWEFNRILFPWFRTILHCLLILVLSIRMLPIFKLTVRLHQLILFNWLWFFFLLCRWGGTICVSIHTSWKSNFKHFPGQSNCSALFICVLL